MEIYLVHEGKRDWIEDWQEMGTLSVSTEPLLSLDFEPPTSVLQFQAPLIFAGGKAAGRRLRHKFFPLFHSLI